MANASNGEPSKEVRVDYQHGSGTDSDHVEVVVQSPSQIQKKKKKNRFLPKLFERSNGNLLNPRFDSDILESYLVTCYFPQIRRMFQNSVCYIGIASLCWALYFLLIEVLYSNNQWYLFSGSVIMVIICIVFFLFARSSQFAKHTKSASIILAIILVVIVQLPFALEIDLQEPGFSPVATFCCVIEIVIMFYSFFPVSFYTAAGFGVFLSVSYEIFTALRHEKMQGADFIVSKVLLHFILHLVGIFIYIMCNTRMRSNFSKIGQSVIAQRDLMVEKEIKEKMIHSLMPPDVAKSVMEAHPQEEDQDEEAVQECKSQSRGEIIFRKFQMDEMKNVSILFADIVGFTKMSSNKTAEKLVGLLNDLFGRFDKLCTASGCEKISTLGDCYYCVSGCPNPCEDHAKCCVEMGLNMVIAIQAFDEDHNEEVNMRVGVHTGTVLCGIVGTRRFKFDVWSNDVTLANTMESSGEPGKVHISAETRKFLEDQYEMVEGEEVADMRGRKELIEHYDPAQSSFTIKHKEEIRNIKTFFITGRKPGKTGIPGLEDLARERPDEIRLMKQEKESEFHTENSKDGQNSSPQNSPSQKSPAGLDKDETENAPATLDLFSQRIPDIMADEEAEDQDDDEKPADDQESCGADTILLSRSDHSKEDQDKLLVSLIQKEDENTQAFFKPQINKIWLTFAPDMEKKYRDSFRDSHLFKEKMLSSPRYQMAVEAFIALIVLIILIICCHIIFDIYRTPGLIVVTIVGLMLQSLVFIDALANVTCLEEKQAKCPGLLSLTLNWYFRNAIGVILASVPAILVYVCFSCDLINSPIWHDRFFCFAVAIALIQYCNYTMLRSHVKTAAAVVVGSVLIILLFVHICSISLPTSSTTASSVTGSFSNGSVSYNTSNSSTPSISTTPSPDVYSEQFLFSGDHVLRFEIILSTLLLLLLISIVNYELEMSYRVSYNASEKAQRDKENMQLNKDQADWLLHNIIPAHLADMFKTNRSYSMNHQDVGVIFATICNFNEFYDEMYAGGREYLRVLNELVSDYEVMLNETRFKDVEKIKTISASFMAAAGLNEERRAQNKHRYAHLFALMEFATELQQVVARFNESIFNFSFILNIGYNYGPVTAGVIGTTKLLYDIWGDTVNIASRMYSTGEANRIQVPQSTAELLNEKFQFTYRDEIYVKGKGMMKTYLLVEKRPGATWE